MVDGRFIWRNNNEKKDHFGPCRMDAAVNNICAEYNNKRAV